MTSSIYRVAQPAGGKALRQGFCRLAKAGKEAALQQRQPVAATRGDAKRPETRGYRVHRRQLPRLPQPVLQTSGHSVVRQAIYAALKPGGVFVIVDHRAPADSWTSDTNTLHRIDSAVVKQEVESAGFVFDGSSDALLNPKDPLTLRIFDKTIRGHTSQFIYRFRKPKG